jgi:large subunit ribosomal protein L4
MKLKQRINQDRQHGGRWQRVQVSEDLRREYNEALVHQVVTAYRNAGRAGTKAPEVARRSAWRRQEAVEPEGHGPGPRRLDPQPDLGRRWPRVRRAPRSFEQKVNRKMYRGAMRSMLSELVRQDRLVVTQTLRSRRRRRKLLAVDASLKSAALSSVLIVVEAIDEKLFLAARNLPHVDVLPAAALDPLALAPTTRC